MSFVQFKVQKKATGEIFNVYAVDRNEMSHSFIDYTEILIYDKKSKAFLWDYIEGYEPIE